ncbi:Si-specific NAD(P)(+) transhydrogenase [Myxococcus sp. CA051A]|uniref:Soluble pyridine nucleotide transhydrogenase n=1 Tax=Myxococcus llanfairpwllgwyngyllgogerychwyrndrobwllllantysiliogogogochensis TaxID=2590453 RepID=A0A540WTF1_9BACT|nr:MULTISPECIES: Si-specific NAD(P)(+) transhydrogenase [Myxococcus]NTX04323.1 Si-specific NAD(P)(+) transhydrogenase [Myxococcus sp. CA040A]NTX13057.1 Si-specific NAD(P)(+) transhydrogenase [Myxococcus sp. CA056]NTX36492.1 Si-specific NAD(P)(+) transhydrogenase [Myxococcus sp. CA033]NTX53607.1 Si-specific NAD(P)(+) transhydrogenase [Myxococcus sp. CA039A]NTX64799.1 Si-specific NAD(P)(+) transhydrogenase [Myxococcus sp. CA051A]
MVDFDLVVIGSGPAGEWGAVQAAMAGKRVAVVERESVLGGTAANTGTLPSKTLRETALHLSGLKARGLYSVETTLRHEATVSDFLYRERRVKGMERERIGHNLQKHGVQVLQGVGSFVDAHTVRVCRKGAEDLLLTGSVILVATGSSPYRPPLYPFGDIRVHDSDEVLEIGRLPSSLVVVGGGVIGCEYACMFAALGIPVTLVEVKPEVLPFLDDEISALLAQRMEALGIRLRFGQTVEKVDVPAACEVPIRLTLSSGEEVDTDQVLVASGRSANTSGLGLQDIGVKLGARGQVEVGPSFQTAVPHIYAVGDVIGFPALASTSMDQARIAVEHAFTLEGPQALATVLPYGIYTIPEVSMAGETEEGLRAKRVPYVAGRAAFATNPRGQIIGEMYGLLKLLFHRESLKLLGVHVIGEQASELVHVGLVAMLTGSTARLFIETCFNYPTLSEAYKAATFDALDHLKHGTV